MLNDRESRVRTQNFLLDAARRSWIQPTLRSKTLWKGKTFRGNSGSDAINMVFSILINTSNPDYNTTLTPIHGIIHSFLNKSFTVVKIDETNPGIMLSLILVPANLAAASDKPAAVVFAIADTT